MHNSQYRLPLGERGKKVLPENPRAFSTIMAQTKLAFVCIYNVGSKVRQWQFEKEKRNFDVASRADTCVKVLKPVKESPPTMVTGAHLTWAAWAYVGTRIRWSIQMGPM